MIQKKLVLKKQVIASLSDIEKKKILGGVNVVVTGPPRFSIDNVCEQTVDLPCDTDMCTLKSDCC